MSEKHAPANETRPRVLPPAVDIYENQEGYLLRAEVPGAGKEDVRVDLDRNELLIEATAAFATPGETVYREFAPVTWQRRFQLGNEVDRSAIDARVENGVLWLTLPKVREARPQRIEIQG